MLIYWRLRYFGIIIYLSHLSIAQAIPIEYTLLAENNFVGQVSQVTLLDPDGSRIGDVITGSKILGKFSLYDTGEGDGSMHLQSDYTFHGITRDYTFGIPGGPFSTWGTLDIDPSLRLEVRFNNNFFSDGLEDTFPFHSGGDDGYFNFILSDYTTPRLSGSGSFGWNNINVDFQLGWATSVPEPSSLILLGVGLIAMRATMKRL